VIALDEEEAIRLLKALERPLREHGRSARRAALSSVVGGVAAEVGLYLAPPERAVVLCVDEKSQIQALDRTAPILPMRPGVPSTPPTTTSAREPRASTPGREPLLLS
jgi:hypothetical protein